MNFAYNMDTQTIYQLALCSGLVIMLAFAALSLFTTLPREVRQRHRSYVRAKRVFGFTLFSWAAYIAMHGLFNLRFTDYYLSMSVSLSCYFMLIGGFEMVLHTLLDESYLTRRRAISQTVKLAIYTAVLAIDYVVEGHKPNRITIIILTVPLFIRMLLTAYRAIKRYNAAKMNIDNYYSEDVSNAVVWIRNSIFMMLALGFSAIMIVYGTPVTDAVTMYIAICVITYLFISLINYSNALNDIDAALYQHPTKSAEPKVQVEVTNERYAALSNEIDKWVEQRHFTTAGVTIKDLSKSVGSNRTYISDYINNTHQKTFRSWIADLRIEYAKEIMKQHPDYPIAKVAEMTGYARSSFVEVFTKVTGTSPNNWREKKNL